jgi:3',5'-cyclic AMP phosphodiesterase CpdA
LVLFTGDLTQSGDEKQFQELDKLLKRFWDKLSAMDPEPRLLAVPGNHDLVRPDEGGQH